MEALLNGTMIVEAALLSCLLAVWITWLGLRGLFRFLPASPRVSTPIQRRAARQAEVRQGSAA